MHTQDQPLNFPTPEAIDESVGNSAVECEFQPNAAIVPLKVTLLFNDQVFIFDGVPPEKVQAVLLLLGGYEFGPKPRGEMSLYKSVDPKRAEYLNKYRRKRKERCYEKKIRYNVRHQVAMRMKRKKGQFAPKNTDEIAMSSAFSDSLNGENPLEIACTHCGISSNDTPMMRKGPNGPRTLCNACGLSWANKWMMRDIYKKFRYDDAFLTFDNAYDSLGSDYEIQISL